jgi:hypothetical protein
MLSFQEKLDRVLEPYGRRAPEPPLGVDENLFRRARVGGSRPPSATQQ